MTELQSLRTWPAGETAPADATADELALHMTLWGSVYVEVGPSTEQP